MVESGILLSLPQMVDLALSSPEVGVVNFNILQSLLHVLIQQVDLIDCKVEFKGDNSERVQSLIKTTTPGPSVNVTEYIVSPGKEQHKVISRKARFKKIGKDGGEEGSFGKEVELTEAGTATTWADTLQTVVVVETGSAPSEQHTSVALTKASVVKLEKDVNKLKEGIEELKGLPSSLGLIDAIRSAGSNSAPLMEMFQFLTISKRVDAIDEAMNKLTGIVEDLARECSNGTSFANTGSFTKEGESPTNTQERDTGGRDAHDRAPRNMNEWMESIDRRLQVLEGSMPEGIRAISPGKQAQGAATTTGGTKAGGTTAGGTAAATKVGGAKAAGTKSESTGEKRIDDLEEKFREYTDFINNMDSSFNSQIEALQQHLTDLEKEIGEIVEKINAGLPAGDNVEADVGVQELYKKMLAMQTELEQVSGTAAILLNEKDNKQTHMDALLEQIELLKTVKANREDLQDALAGKADACTLNKKVSHSQFDAACDDLTRNIEEALKKLREQEKLWSQALEDIQTEIESKLDKMELTPLRDFVHNKLKMLQDRLKALSSLKQDTEAAGTKSKILRNVNCLSCDKDVVMRRDMDPTQQPPAPSLPPTKSMGPYLAYELDQLRKEQKCAAYGRNMNHFENALSSAKLDRNHICNRYCGGSHTLTTPQQRVARVGHFLQQWGPESTLVNEGEIRGMDGHMYKARNPLEFVQDQRTATIGDSSTNTKPSILVNSDIISARASAKKGEAPVVSAAPSIKAKS